VHYRPQFGAFGGSLAKSSLTFVSQAALKKRVPEKYGLSKTVVAVKGIRSLSKKRMIHNALTPKITVDPETYQVHADGVLLDCEPARELPMAQRYFLF
jgi:urease subunit alpha